MLYKVLTIYGFIAIWFVMFTVFSLILKNIGYKIDERNKVVDKIHGSLVWTFIFNIVIALSIAYIIVLMYTNIIHWSWGTIAIIMTFIYYIFLYLMIKIGNSMIEHDRREEIVVGLEDKGLGIKEIDRFIVVESKRLLGIYLLNLIMFIAIHYVSIVDIGLREWLIPPMIPLYLYLIFYVVIFIFIMLLNALMIVKFNDLVFYKKMRYYMLNRHSINKKQKEDGNSEDII